MNSRYFSDIRHLLRSVFSVFMMTTIGAVPWVCADQLEDCMRTQLGTASDTMTVGELRQHCLSSIQTDEQTVPEMPGAVEKRLVQEQKNIFRPFSIMPHRPNYILAFVYNSHGYNSSYHQQSKNDDSYAFDWIETQFQISIKTPLMVGLFDNTMDVYAAYTNHSFWQVYNRDISSPFRETNHEPEAWVQFKPGWEAFGIVNSSNSFGINHQSNGQSGELSRSWNRLFAAMTFEVGDLGLTFMPWYRIPEGTNSDDNPDITRYLGHYEISAAYKWDDHTFSLMTRNALESDFQRGTLQVSWSFPFGNWPFLRGYVQYFTGYGESLIDYNHYVNRIGIGVSLVDWL
jgi:phospholipase A1